MVGSSLTVLIAAVSSISGFSRSAGEIRFRLRMDQARIGSLIGRRTENISHIAPRKEMAVYTLSPLSEVRGSNARSHLSAIPPGGHRTAHRCYFRPNLPPLVIPTDSTWHNL